MREHGLFLHAPGELGEVTQSPESVAFRLTNWISGQARVLIGGFSSAPGVIIDGNPAPIVWPHEFDAARGLLVLGVRGTNAVRILHPAVPRLRIKAAITNGAVELSWPTANSNFVLQQTPTLQAIGQWSDSTASVDVAGDWRVATIPVSPTPHFFRLKSTP